MRVRRGTYDAAKFLTMNLTEEQKAIVARWMEEGFKLSEIQNKLGSELGLTVTYMELRFLLDDLKLKPKDKPPLPTPVAPPPPAPTAPARSGLAGPPPPSSSPALDELDAEPALGQAVSVEVDHIAQPGALASGKVTFSDGKMAQWTLDQMGRLGLAAKEPGYRPSQQDLMAFQAELQRALEKIGF